MSDLKYIKSYPKVWQVAENCKTQRHTFDLNFILSVLQWKAAASQITECVKSLWGCVMYRSKVSVRFAW